MSDHPPLIRRCRNALGLSAEGFAAVLHVSPRTVQNWDAGQRVPGPAWVAVGHLLRAAGHAGIAADIDGRLAGSSGRPDFFA